MRRPTRSCAAPCAHTSRTWPPIPKSSCSSTKVSTSQQFSKRSDIVANADAYSKTLLAIVEEGIASGVFRNDLDPRLVMLGILGMHNWIHRWYVPGGRNTLTEIGDTFAAMVLVRPAPLKPPTVRNHAAALPR